MRMGVDTGSVVLCDPRKTMEKVPEGEKITLQSVGRMRNRRGQPRDVSGAGWVYIMDSSRRAIGHGEKPGTQ